MEQTVGCPATPQRPETTALTPAEALATAVAHEQGELGRYRWLSLRFLAHGRGVSRLMEALADESRQRVQILVSMAQRLEVAESLSPTPTRQRRTYGPRQAHFFFLGRRAAAVMLKRALRDERRSLRFYESLRDSCGAPELLPVLDDFIRQLSAQCRILEESQPPSTATRLRPAALAR